MQDGIRIVEAVPPSVDGGTASISTTRAIARIAWLLATWPVRRAVALATSLIVRLYVFYFVQADSKAKCPACGIRAEHDVRWSDMASALVHVCKRCLAVWSEAPMVAFDRWRTTLSASVDEEGAVVGKDGTRTTTVQHAQREPQVVSDFRPTHKDKPIIIRMGGTA